MLFEYILEERGWKIKVLELSADINIWRAAVWQKFGLILRGLREKHELHLHVNAL